MQQTEKYKFNIIETSDAFSPDALNANARTAEAQLAALADADAALAQADKTNKTALEQALAAAKSTLEAADAANKSALQTAINTNKSTADAAINALNNDVKPGSPGQIARIVTGTYVGKGSLGANPASTLDFSFKPILLFINSSYDNISLLLMRPGIYSSNDVYGAVNVTWGEKSVTWSNQYPNSQCNLKDVTYSYIAIGVPV